jgi:hypothetical protein
MQRYRESSAIRTSGRRGSGRNALDAADSIGSYALDAQLRSGYKRSVRRRRLRSLLSDASEGLALIFLLGMPILAYLWGVAHG